MTSAQLRLAKTGQAPAWIFSRVARERKGCVNERVGEEEERVRRG